MWATFRATWLYVVIFAVGAFGGYLATSKQVACDCTICTCCPGCANAIQPCKCGCVESGECKCRNCDTHTADPNCKDGKCKKCK